MIRYTVPEITKHGCRTLLKQGNTEVLKIFGYNSPENRARQNVSSIRGLTTKMIAEAQALLAELGSAENILVPLDQYRIVTDKLTNFSDDLNLGIDIWWAG